MYNKLLKGIAARGYRAFHNFSTSLLNGIAIYYFLQKATMDILIISLLRLEDFHRADVN